MNLICSWSGGKDSCFALMQMPTKPKVLLNTLNERGDRSRSHGLSKEILMAQARAIGCDIAFIETTWDEYRAKYIHQLQQLTKQYNLTDAVFGDIDLESHRAWEEMVCNEANIQGHLPLWQQDRKELVFKMIDSGLKAIIVSCNAQLGSCFLGKTLNEQTLLELERKGVDVCGENGEFHTLVLDCPLFQQTIDVEPVKLLSHNNYHFLELQLLDGYN